MEINKIYHGDSLEVLKTFPDNSIDCCMTSPPYWAVRNYEIVGQLGQEPSYNEYINKLCDIFDEVKRVLKSTGTCWANIGDVYGGTGDKGDWKDPKYRDGRNGQKKALNKSATGKCLCQIPSRFAIEMTNRGWLLRNEIIWKKPNAMPSSVKDRFTVDFEYLFFFVKQKKYWFKQQKEDMKTKDVSSPRGSKGVLGSKNSGLRKQDGTGNPTYTGFNGRYVPCKDFKRNMRSVWTINTQPLKEEHFATYPEQLCITPIAAGCPRGGIVLDPFFGAGTTGLVAKKLGRNYIGIELNPEYIKIAEKRINPSKKIEPESNQMRLFEIPSKLEVT